MKKNLKLDKAKDILAKASNARYEALGSYHQNREAIKENKKAFDLHKKEFEVEEMSPRQRKIYKIKYILTMIIVYVSVIAFMKFLFSLVR